MGISVGGAIIALVYAYSKYIGKGHVPVADTQQRSSLTGLAYNKFYIDELYDFIIRKPLDGLSVFFYKVVDLLGIDGIVNGIGRGSLEAGKDLRLLQSGNVGFYIFMMVIGVITVLGYGIYTILHLI